MYDVLIVGGGPAGLTAGLYAARAGKSVLLLEKQMAGGQVALTDKMENYPGFIEGIGGPELAMAMAEQAIGAGVKVFYEGAEEIDCAGRRVRTRNGWHEARQLILALGAKPRRLEVEGEERLIGRGISFCATCDGALYRGKRVAVVGGGNAAVEEALYLAGLGCDVLLIHRREAFRAERALADRVLQTPKITVLWNSRITAFIGGQKLDAIRLNGEREEAVEGVFISIGRVPDTVLLQGQVAMDEAGFIIAGEDCRTNVPGVFVAGDARTKDLRQVVTAVADGAIAASALESILGGEVAGGSLPR